MSVDSNDSSPQCPKSNREQHGWGSWQQGGEIGPWCQDAFRWMEMEPRRPQKREVPSFGNSIVRLILVCLLDICSLLCPLLILLEAVMGPCKIFIFHSLLAAQSGSRSLHWPLTVRRNLQGRTSRKVTVCLSKRTTQLALPFVFHFFFWVAGWGVVWVGPHQTLCRGYSWLCI